MAQGTRRPDDTPFLPNVIKFFPFPELVPAAGPVPLDGPLPWTPAWPFDALREDARFRADGALLYVHVPYCDFFCHYCPLYKTQGRDDYGADAQERFVEGVGRELEFHARNRGDGPPVSALYLGGGTPTSLPVPLLKRIVAHARDAFDTTSDLELTVEGIPSHFRDARRADALRDLGVNRISYGVQSLQSPVRDRLGRKDSVDDCFAAREQARASGIPHVNVDMMYGYPDQTEEMFAADVEAVRELAPDSADFYYYMQVMGTPYRQIIARGSRGGGHAVPLAEMRRHLLDRMKDWHLVSAECFQRADPTPPRIWSLTCGGSTGASEVIALGPSSYGQIRGTWYYQEKDLASWQAALDEGRLPVRAAVRLGKSMGVRRLLLGSVLMGGIPGQLLEILPASARRAVRRWRAAGLLKEEGGDLKLTRSGLERFQMLPCEQVPALHAFSITRNYMMSFAEQRALLFSGGEALYGDDIARMAFGRTPVLRALRRASYWLLLRLPDRVLGRLADLVERFVRWRLSREAS